MKHRYRDERYYWKNGKWHMSDDDLRYVIGPQGYYVAVPAYMTEWKRGLDGKMKSILKASHAGNLHLYNHNHTF